MLETEKRIPDVTDEFIGEITYLLECFKYKKEKDLLTAILFKLKD